MYSRLLYEADQAQSRDRLALKIRKAHTLLDLRDLDASWPSYAQAAGHHVESEWNVSVLNALYYLVDLLIAASHAPADVQHPNFDAGHVRDLLWLTGPGRIKELIDAGWEDQAAALSAARASVLSAQHFTTQEAQDALQEASADAEDTSGMSMVQGYLRIAKPTACAFCRRLAGATRHIGLVYNVTTKWRTPHPNCRCSLEPQPVYKLLRVRHPEEIAATAQMYAALRRQRDEALFTAQRDLIAA